MHWNLHCKRSIFFHCNWPAFPSRRWLKQCMTPITLWCNLTVHDWSTWAANCLHDTAPSRLVIFCQFRWTEGTTIIMCWSFQASQQQLVVIWPFFLFVVFFLLDRSTQIKTYSWDNAQVVLAGNKCDMEEERVVSVDSGRLLAEQLGESDHDSSTSWVYKR